MIDLKKNIKLLITLSNQACQSALTLTTKPAASPHWSSASPQAFASPSASDRAIKAAAIKQVHKFSIGKDFNSVEQLQQQQTPPQPTVAASQHHTDSSSSSEQQQQANHHALFNLSNVSVYSNFIPPTLITKPIQTSSSRKHHLPLSMAQPQQHQQHQATASRITAPLLASESTTTSGDPKWERIRRRLRLVNKNTGINVLSQLIGEILVAKEINYANLTKGYITL